MGQIPQPNAGAQGDPAPLLNKTFSAFKGVYTRASRTAIPDDYFYDLVNMIPIGNQNLHVVHNLSSALVDYTTDTIYWSQGVNLNGVEYLVNFASNGKVFFYNINAHTSAQVNVGNLLSGAGSQCDQWQNTAILFIDSTGYYSYDGATFTKITGAGVPTAGQSIAVYAQYVWIVNNRQLYVTGNGGGIGYVAANFTAANGAQVVTLVDPQIRSTVSRLKAQNGYLYLIAQSSINAISDVYVPSGASPPTPLFSNQNIQALIGTDQPASIFAYDRYLMFASKYGGHTLFGVSAPKVSGDIDGTWQYVDFTQQISGGQVVVESILCGAFLLKQTGDPTFGNRNIIALWFQQSDTAPQTGVTENTDIWWFCNFGAVTFIVTGMVANEPALFGFIGNKLYQFFVDENNLPASSATTKLWPMEDELARKEAITAGVEFYAFNTGTNVALSLDTEFTSIQLTLNQNLATGNWINQFGVQGLWINNALQTGGWVAPGLFLLVTDAQGGFGRHVGLTLTFTGFHAETHLLALDYKIRDRWL